MGYFLFKTTITALVIATVSEISKRYTLVASLLAALPLTTIVIFLWMYIEQKDVRKISGMSYEVFVLVIPSLAFFLILPYFIKRGFGFYVSLSASIALTVVIYFIYMKLIKIINLPGPFGE